MSVLPIFLSHLLAAGVTSPAAAEETTQEILETGLQVTRVGGTYLLIALGIYIVLILIGRLLKQRLRLPLGWSFNFFCMFVALYLPTLSDALPIPGRKHLGALVIITGAIALNKLIRHALLNLRSRRKEGAEVPKFFGEIVSTIIIIGTLLAVLQFAYDVKVPGLLAGAGIAGLVLGLALQDTLGNIFSGFAIYFGGQFKAGDWLLVEGHHAKIVEINWRSTRLRTTDDITLDIPNSAITKEIVVNYNSPTSIHGMRMEIGLDYDSSPALVKAVLIEAALDCPHVLRHPKPNVYMKRFADWSIIYELRYWLDDHVHYDPTNSQINTALWHSLKRNGIQIPYPISRQQNLGRPTPHVEDRDLIRKALENSLLAPILSEVQFSEVIEHSRIVHFGNGENIVRQGTEAGPMYILTSGHAEVWIESEGQRTRVAELKPGACIGEVSVLTGEPRMATVHTTGDCTAVEVQKSTLAPILASSPQLLDTLSQLLARRRMENEGLLSAETSHETKATETRYTNGFLHKLRAFFEV